MRTCAHTPLRPRPAASAHRVCYEPQWSSSFLHSDDLLPNARPTTLQLQTLSNPLLQANFQSHVPWKVRVSRGSPGGSVVKNVPTQEPQGTRVGSQDWEDPLEGEIATHSSALAWRIPWTEKPGGLQSMGLQRVRQDRATARMHPCVS